MKRIIRRERELRLKAKEILLKQLELLEEKERIAAEVLLLTMPLPWQK